MGEKTQMNRKLKLVFATTLLISLLMVASVYAVWKYTATVTNTVNVTGYQVSLWRTDTNAAVTSISWGNINMGASNNTEQVFGVTEKLAIKNTGDIIEYVAWNVSGIMPLGFSVTAEFKPDSTWHSWAQNDFGSTIGTINPGEIRGGYVFRFTLTVTDNATRGPATFTINLLAATTASG